MKKVLLGFNLLFAILLTAQEDKASIPEWVLKDWEKQVAGTGKWITSNEKYKGEQEPYDAYGMDWEWGLGKKSIKGKLYGIKGEKKADTFWEFLNYWDTDTQQQRMIQIGATGFVGQGVFELQSDKSTKSREKFVGLDGASFESGHHTWFANREMYTQSFDIKGDEWTKRRFYIWKPVPEISITVPDVYAKIAWLIGAWEIDLGKIGKVQMRFTWGDNQRMIYYESTNPNDGTRPETFEAKGIITYHGVKDQVVFMNTYLGKGDNLISEGWYDFKADGSIHRRFSCHYREGEGLPWSNGAKAPKGGKTLKFKQVWTPIDKDSFAGEFYWQKDGKWVPPYESKDGKRETWRRVQ